MGIFPLIRTRKRTRLFSRKIRNRYTVYAMNMVYSRKTSLKRNPSPQKAKDFLLCAKKTIDISLLVGYNRQAMIIVEGSFGNFTSLCGDGRVVDYGSLERKSVSSP